MDFEQAFGQWLPWAPEWLLAVLLFAIIVAVGLVVQSVGVKILSRLTFGKFGLSDLLARVKGILRYALVLLAASLAFPAVPMPSAMSEMLHDVLIASTILLAGWIAIILANTLAERYVARLRTDVADNLHARKAVTQVRILKRAADTLLLVLTLAFALMSFPSVHTFGVSLFASAGAAGLVVGLAARPLLESLFAGVQIALTQPFRLEDVLVVQGQWGWVEEINSTYIVMRLWDKRRYVLPLSYLMQNPFENWTRTSSSIIGSVLLYLDYSAPMDELRQAATDIVKASKRWDGQVVNVQVSDVKTDTIEFRVLVSAVDSPTVWDLRCEVREKLLAHLAAAHPDCLPRRRILWRDDADPMRSSTADIWPRGPTDGGVPSGDAAAELEAKP